MNYTLIWSWKNRLEVFKNSIYTAHFFFPSQVKFLIVDGGSTLENLKELRKFVSLLDRDIRLVETNGNTICEAWNLGLSICDTRYAIIASSDVEFTNHGLINQLALVIEEGYRYVLVDNHAVFMMDRAIIPYVGLFDERFDSGPHFDTDYLIRITEAKIKWRCVNNSFYKHGDSHAETVLRTTTSVADRLPMNTFHNEDFFRSKWDTDWPGWRLYIDQVHKPHPPISIDQVDRKLNEVNWNPSLVAKMRRYESSNIG